MLKAYKCNSCGFTKKHFFNKDQVRKLSCKKCGSVDQYLEKLGTFSTSVNYNTLEEIFENEIDPSVQNTLEKIGKEFVAGDVSTMENIVGENKMKETFYESDTWVDEKMME